MTQDRDSIRFNALRNALYHTARRRSLERFSRVFNFLIVVLGATAVSSVAVQFHLPSYLIGLAIAVIGALQLVFDFGRQARDHQVLQRDYYALLADVEANVDPTPADLATFSSRMIRITADEPPTYRAIDSKAYNDAIDGLGTHAAGERLHIPLLHRIFGGMFAFDGYGYRKRVEIETGQIARG
ncbi:hypothetical protein [Pseudorhodobacter sp.]|uniref:hypothetical protein n=1 Tax=Pseudorhodobacter sp. TaxID=1934400 RepID=UPI0026486B39|nr:hypothetical protein [Pseudorhodobacter sp.]MDN5785714.1 hypothetical protein [Pseudorhodobacter sp.]